MRVCTWKTVVSGREPSPVEPPYVEQCHPNEVGPLCAIKSQVSKERDKLLLQEPLGWHLPQFIEDPEEKPFPLVPHNPGVYGNMQTAVLNICLWS